MSADCELICAHATHRLTFSSESHPLKRRLSVTGAITTLALKCDVTYAGKISDGFDYMQASCDELQQQAMKNIWDNDDDEFWNSQ